MLVAVAPASAWGPLGHRAVGAVADALLAPAARREIHGLLDGAHPMNGEALTTLSLAQVSTWADDVRGSPDDRPRWHYDNAPVCAEASSEHEPAWCVQDECASRRIGPLLRSLADRSAPPEQRRLALKWIAHLVADMHQPLHAADYAQGGNQVAVQIVTRYGVTAHMSLHYLWDSRLVGFALHAHGDEFPPDHARQALTARARSTARALVRAPPEQWLAESNRLARRVAFDYPGFTCAALPDQPVPITAAYERRAQQVVRAQLALAGARLAYVLNQALSAP